MKSLSHHVIKKFKTDQDIVYSQDFVVAAAFLFRELYNKTMLTIEALDMT